MIIAPSYSPVELSFEPHAYRPSKHATKKYTVQGRTVDDMAFSAFGLAPIDIAKIDVEGAEAEFILGDCPSCKTLARCKHLLIEIHEAKTAHLVRQAIERSGLRLHVDGQSNGCGVHLFSN